MANIDNIRPYFEFSKTAAQNGGVENYLNEISQASYEQGVLDEKGTEWGKAIVLVLSTVFLVKFGEQIKKKWEDWRNRKREAARLREENAKIEIINCIDNVDGLDNGEENSNDDLYD